MLAAILCAAMGGCARHAVVIDGEDLSREAAEAARASGYKPSWFRHDTLHVYAWEDFFAPNVVASFEKALGVTVIVEAFESNEEVYEKLKAGEGEFDIITPSSYIIPTLAKDELIVKLNHLHLPNVRKNFDTRLKPMLVDPMLTYNVPYAVSHTAIHYDRNQLPPGADPESFGILGNTELRGRTALFDDMRETLGVALMYLGYSINTVNPAELDAATDLLIQWKRNAGRTDDAFYDEDIRTGKLAVAMNYSYLAFQSLGRECASNVVQDVKIPAKGGFSLAVDEFVIAACSRQKRLAHAFINYIYEPNVARSSMESRYSITPVRQAFDKLKPELRDKIVLSPEQMRRGQIIMGFNDRPKVAQLYEDAWARFKAAD